jgi:hypothetical protein
MKLITTVFIGVSLSVTSALAQSTHRFHIQGGYLYATSALIRTSNALIGLPEVTPKPGFYVGLTYQHQLSTRLTGALELTYQHKGYVGRSPSFTSTNPYAYLGLTPMLGIKVVRNLRLSAGPQGNVLVNRTASGNERKKVEFGLLGRVSYQLNRVGLSAGYFRGLTAYEKTDFHYLTNQNWQLGLFYQLNRNKY